LHFEAAFSLEELFWEDPLKPPHHLWLELAAPSHPPRGDDEARTLDSDGDGRHLNNPPTFATTSRDLASAPGTPQTAGQRSVFLNRCMHRRGPQYLAVCPLLRPVRSPPSFLDLDDTLDPRCW
jgi:hypothetical protein